MQGENMPSTTREFPALCHKTGARPGVQGIEFRTRPLFFFGAVLYHARYRADVGLPAFILHGEALLGLARGIPEIRGSTGFRGFGAVRFIRNSGTFESVPELLTPTAHCGYKAKPASGR